MNGPPDHRTTSELDGWWHHVEAAPKDAGTVEMLVFRPDVGRREVVDEAKLNDVEGMVGDSWAHRTGYEPDPLRQLTVMNTRVLDAIAGDRAFWPAAGDQIYVDLDISEENLPAGSRLGLGSAVIEITEPPHAGCPKFKARFGGDALLWVNGRRGRSLRMRGANARVVESGTVSTGDTVRPLR